MLKEIELTCRRVERTEQLIAKFVDGYASGWEFIVKEAFKDSLDIKKTSKMINKKKFEVWTQGVLYNFEIGDSFSNSMVATENWSEFLQGENPVTVQVQFGGSSGYETKKTTSIITTPLKIKVNSKTETIESLSIQEQFFKKGNLQIKILKPNIEKTKLEDVESIHISVVDFVSLLQNGTFYDEKEEKYISLKYEG